MGYDEVFNKIAVSIRGQQDEAAVFFEMKVLSITLKKVVTSSP